MENSIPGLNVPVDWVPKRYWSRIDRGLFPAALNIQQSGYHLLLTVLREFTMLQLMNQLTDKPRWDEKIFDEATVEKWRLEALNSEGKTITPKMFDWIVDELRYKAKIFKETGAVSIYNGDVVKSDSAIPETLKEALKAGVRPLEDIDESLVDYHPGSKGTVIDLVHPSLFPLVYGRSRVLRNPTVNLDDSLKMIGSGTIIFISPEEQARVQNRSENLQSYFTPENSSPEYSVKFQWLPCQVDISEKDDSVKISSYINNLHPKWHSGLYKVLEQIISKVIPLWNMTLSPLADESLRIRRIEYTDVHYNANPWDVPEGDRPQWREDEEEFAFYAREEQWLEEFRSAHFVYPEPETFEPPFEHDQSALDERGIHLRKMYSANGLQVIVKLANICLTPEKPLYEGGSWHVEGQMNEHICASAIYYYDSDNITESRLAFRQQGDEESATEVNYEQNDNNWSKAIFGIANDEPLVQDVGDVECREGRLITFPNILQHQVSSFQLMDPTKPGHRKILALFLVDPNIKVISTADVPPQQREWWGEEVIGTGCLDLLSREIQGRIFEDVDYPIGLEEAKSVREKLMEERAEFVVKQTERFHMTSFSLCEH